MNNGRMIRALAVDDNFEHRKSFERLNNEHLVCKSIPPPAPNSFSEEILQPVANGDFDVVLLDFRLDEVSDIGNGPASYRGGTPAAAIKEKSSKMPVVLVTSSENQRIHIENNPHIGSLFDYSIPKSSISKSEERSKAVADIVDIGEGFHRIHEVLNSRPGSAVLPELLTSVLALQDDELETVLDCLGGIPLESTAEVADWLLKEFLKYSGPLLEEDEARARLGLTKESFLDPAVQQWLAASRYEGVFSTIYRRWWEGRLLGQLREASENANVDVAGKSHERVEAVRHACPDGELTADVCSFCESGLIQRSCSICHETVDATHNLTARVDPRPAWALPAIVCFRCIQTGRDEGRGIRYGPGTRLLVEDIKDAR
jgi:CheY-like chemotaxis protein